MTRLSDGKSIGMMGLGLLGSALAERWRRPMASHRL
jgi:hypothetical protein